MGLLSELRRRSVFRMATLYVVSAWLVMQVAEAIITLGALPDWSGQVVLVLLAIGFPIALVLSWFYELTPAGISLQKDVLPGDTPDHAHGRRIDFMIIALLSAAVLMFAWHTWWPGSSRDALPVPYADIESIAVLPLSNLSNDPAQQYFVDGMQDALITRLTRLTDLRVISRTSTLRYEETNKTIPEIARELGVDALIEGSVLRDADRVRITAKLVLGAEDQHLWANSYDRDLDRVLPLINEISLAIADEIEVAVEQQASEDYTGRDPVNLEVHELLLQGNHHFERFMFDRSLDSYRQAVELDPGFAPAHAGVAGSYLLLAFFGTMDAAEAIPAARESALEAIALDENSAEGYSTLGGIQLYYDWDWEAARNNLSRALELRPNDARTRHAYADYLMVMGDLDGSLYQVELGKLYDPFSPMANMVLQFHRLLARQYETVTDDASAALAENPEIVVELPYYRQALWLAGRHAEALEIYRQTWGRDPELLAAMNEGLAEAGYTGALLGLAHALSARPDFTDDVALASLYASAGEAKLALEALERAYERRQPQILHIKAMPAFDELHSNPGFQDLLHRIGFPA